VHVQPAKKKARRLARKAKAAKIAPRPAAGLLKPAVRCPTIRYNTKVKAGRGFSLDELKNAGISKKLAQSIGIAVDHRRKNKSAQTLADNVQRLNAYKAKLVVFPRKSNAHPKKGDSGAEELKLAQQLPGALFPITQKSTAAEFVPVTEDLIAKRVYAALRQERCNARMVGKRAKKAKEAAEKGPEA